MFARGRRRAEAVMTLEEVRREWPVLRTAFLMAEEMYQEMNPGAAADLGVGPTFDELLECSRRYLDTRVVPMEAGGVWSNPEMWASTTGVGRRWTRWTQPFVELGPRASGGSYPRVARIARSGSTTAFQWTGIVAEGKRCHTNQVPCHTDLEKRFADFLDASKDVVRYFKNERLGFPSPIMKAIDRGSTTRTLLWLRETLTVERSYGSLKLKARFGRTPRLRPKQRGCGAKK